MAKLKLEMPQWQINLIRGRVPARVGVVEAPDAARPIQRAIREFKIADPERQKRISAYRVA